MNTTAVLITPAMAKTWLEHNPSNRPIKMACVEAYMRDMIAGKWLLTHQGIAFDKDGNLLDGQHRLTAIALCGLPVMMNVTTDMPREYMIAVDNGTVRSPTDSFAVSGMYEGEFSDFRKRNCISIINAVVELGYSKRVKLTNAERTKLIDKFGEEAITVWKAQTKGAALSSPIRAAALAALLNGEPAEDVQKFIRVFASGDSSNCFGLNTPAAYNFSRYVLKAKANKMTIARSRLFMLAQHAIYQFIRGDKQNVAKGSGKMTTFKYPVYEIIKKALEE